MLVVFFVYFKIFKFYLCNFVGNEDFYYYNDRDFVRDNIFFLFLSNII